MGIKKVKLNYRPIAKRKSNEISFEISQRDINSLNKSIHNKLNRNLEERIQSSVSAHDYHVGSSYNENTTEKIFVKRKN